MRTFLFLFVLLTAPANAQIYADFTVSSGGNPLGTFTVTLEHEKAPRTCANFIGLATGKRPWIDLTNGAVRTNKPYYDGLTFHRLDHDFVIQGGSRNGLGTDGPDTPSSTNMIRCSVIPHRMFCRWPKAAFQIPAAPSFLSH